MNDTVHIKLDGSKSPFNIEFLMVLCSGIQYMAYLDNGGTWRSAFDNRELHGSVRVLW